MGLHQANGIFRGYVRTALVKGGIPTGKNSCRVLVLNAAAPGLQVAVPNDSTDTVGGPATLFADYTPDTAGYYEISLPPGNYKVIFWATHFVPRTYSITINAGETHEPVFSYYENDERPIKPGTAIDPWEGGPTHAFLEFDRDVTRPDPVNVVEPEKQELKDLQYKDGKGIFRGYVRTTLVKGGNPSGKNGCRVLVLNAAAPGLQVAVPNESTDTVGGPGILFADYTTDTAGYYEISLPPGNYKVIFWATHFVPRTYTITINAGETHEPVFSYDENDERRSNPERALIHGKEGPPMPSWNSTAALLTPIPPTWLSQKNTNSRISITGISKRIFQSISRRRCGRPRWGIRPHKRSMGLGSYSKGRERPPLRPLSRGPISKMFPW